MTSLYPVTVSLDEVSKALWSNLPIGERSERVRTALGNAAIVNERDMLIKQLRKRLDALGLALKDIQLFCECERVAARIEGLII